ncbi:unnamed protein product [Pleuronectes platessa]|uniref:Uncharacterized protein n=1 Tax=Pleuronectes platessa TaxID=8262 RepID=A0A9N7Z0Y3_PLEPL|nr:unnamed protein product [Pleuronectes platessa]
MDVTVYPPPPQPLAVSSHTRLGQLSYQDPAYGNNKRATEALVRAARGAWSKSVRATKVIRRSSFPPSSSSASPPGHRRIGCPLSERQSTETRSPHRHVPGANTDTSTSSEPLTWSQQPEDSTQRARALPPPLNPLPGWLASPPASFPANTRRPELRRGLWVPRTPALLLRQTSASGGGQGHNIKPDSPQHHPLPNVHPQLGNVQHCCTCADVAEGVSFGLIEGTKHRGTPWLVVVGLPKRTDGQK